MQAGVPGMALNRQHLQIESLGRGWGAGRPSTSFMLLAMWGTWYLCWGRVRARPALSETVGLELILVSAVPPCDSDASRPSRLFFPLTSREERDIVLSDRITLPSLCEPHHCIHSSAGNRKVNADDICADIEVEGNLTICCKNQFHWDVLKMLQNTLLF